MKNRLLILFVVSVCVILPTLSSCEKEFNPRDKYKDITIVYGLVNPVDSVHYLRIHKAFLGNESIIIMAQNPDSSLYPVEDLDVRVYDIDQNGNSTKFTVRDTIIKNKESGDFYYPEQRAYYFEKKFEKTSMYGEDFYRCDDTIRIEVENKKTGKIVYAQTSLVNSFNVKSPMRNMAFDINPKQNSSVFRWNNAKNGRIYDVYYTMHYREGNHDKPSSDYVKKTIVWYIGQYSAPSTGNGSEQTQNFNFNPGAFYAQIIRDIPYDENVWRTPYDSVTVAIWCGSEDLYYYHNINSPSQDLVQERPEYTNLKVKIYSEELGDYKEIENEAFGIFSSRIVQYIPLHLSADMTQIHLPATDRQFKGVAFQD